MPAYLATFHTHYGALRFNKYCQKAGWSAKMMPVPRSISASCGTCVRFVANALPDPAEQEDMAVCYIIAEDGSYIPMMGMEG